MAAHLRYPSPFSPPRDSWQGINADTKSSKMRGQMAFGGYVTGQDSAGEYTASTFLPTESRPPQTSYSYQQQQHGVGGNWPVGQRDRQALALEGYGTYTYGRWQYPQCASTGWDTRYGSQVWQQPVPPVTPPPEPQAAQGYNGQWYAHPRPSTLPYHPCNAWNSYQSAPVYYQPSLTQHDFAAEQAPPPPSFAPIVNRDRSSNSKKISNNLNADAPIAYRLRSSGTIKNDSNNLNAGAAAFEPTSQQSGSVNAVDKVTASRVDKTLRINQANFGAASTKPQKSAKTTQPPVKEKKVRPSKRERQLTQFAALSPEEFINLSASDQVAALSFAARSNQSLTSSTPSPASTPRAEKKSLYLRQTQRIHVMERPVPTPFYMQCANAESQALGHPRPLLVVLDLNGTLLFRKQFGGSNAFIPRPGVYPLLEYLFKNHVVLVWSSARPQNVAKMVSDLFSAEQAQKLVAVWARDKLGLTPDAYNQKVQVYKQLSWIWNVPSIHAKNSFDGLWSQANTVLIDDSVDKAASEPHNIIRIDEFEAKPEQMEEDVLSQVAQYLHILRGQRDVSAYIRSKPFEYVPEKAKKKADTPMQ